MTKPVLARGMRDFTPTQVYAREYIFNTIRETYRKYGFQPIETPVIEDLSVLTGKYGEEGDKLLFKILDSGEYLKDVPAEALESKDYKKVTPAITGKGMRYDLTVPLARFVVMNRNELVFPFKRYHIDKVWRADRPAKGRYREFYQCDADTIGSPSLLYDAECILLFDEVLTKLNIPPFYIKVNNRKILTGIAEEGGFLDKFNDFAVAIDKWDKIGEDGVIRELANRGFSESQMHRVQQLFRLKGTRDEMLTTLDAWFRDSAAGKKGLEEIREVFRFTDEATLSRSEITLDLTLARGLDYYTSTIFEVVIKDYAMGSIASGGRYNDLTAAFGVPDMPGVGISFGAERIYDVMLDLKLFPEKKNTDVKIMLVNFGGKEERYAFRVLARLRKAGIGSELYPAAGKMGKQFQYAEKKGIPNVLILGSEEIRTDTFSLKNLENGEQKSYNWLDLLEKLGEL